MTIANPERSKAHREIGFHGGNHAVIPGRAKREPGIQPSHPNSGFRVCVLRTHPGMTTRRTYFGCSFNDAELMQ
jgi:hypothetical protein